MMQADVVVRGAGVVGQTLALSLARQGLRVTLVTRVHADALNGRSPDVRAYALNAASRGLLQQLKVWDALPPDAVTPVFEMQVAGDALGAQLNFSAWQQGVEALAWIVDVPALEQALSAAVRFAPHITQSQDVGQLQAPLTALCEGKTSATCTELGVSVSKDLYGQQAVAARLLSEHSHNGTAHQWFGSPEVLALLPMDAPQQGRTIALVWSVSETRAAQLLALPTHDFEQALVQATGGALGQLTLASERCAWPLERTTVANWCGPSWVLLGDAAHNVHPLAGQGLNLGLADVACLTQVLANREPWRAVGDDKLLRRYARARAGPTWAMTEGVDGLWLLFAAQNDSLREIRNRGLILVNRVPVLKRWLAGRALGF